MPGKNETISWTFYPKHPGERARHYADYTVGVTVLPGAIHGNMQFHEVARLVNAFQDILNEWPGEQPE